MYLKAAVGSNTELHAGLVSLEFRFSRNFNLASAAGDFHHFRRADVKGELAARQDYANCLARAIGEQHGVRYALAIEKYVVFFNDADIFKFVRHDIFYNLLIIFDYLILMQCACAARSA